MNWSFEVLVERGTALHAEQAVNRDEGRAQSEE
jgi:hypothetical protein